MVTQIKKNEKGTALQQQAERKENERETVGGRDGWQDEREEEEVGDGKQEGKEMDGKTREKRRRWGMGGAVRSTATDTRTLRRSLRLVSILSCARIMLLMLLDAVKYPSHAWVFTQSSSSSQSLSASSSIEICCQNKTGGLRKQESVDGGRWWLGKSWRSVLRTY